MTSHINQRLAEAEIAAKRFRTWEISDLDGSNRRTVTLAQYRAELDAAKIVAIANYNKAKAEVEARR